MPHQAYSSRAPEAAQRGFPSPFDQIDPEEYSGDVPDYLEAPHTLQDIDMQQLSYAIRSKEGWETKRLNPEIRAKWKAEALQQDVERERGESAMTETMIDYVLDELALHERDLSHPRGIRHSCFDKIYESDSLISAEARRALLDQIAKLEAVPDNEKDWHPGSDQQVLDLVHPSLYPLIYGRTVLRTRDQETGELKDELSVAPAPVGSKHSTSAKFQWLPTDFTISEDGKVAIKSYINNVHPERQASFYPVLADLFEAFVPMFERVLSDLQKPPRRRINPEDVDPYSWYPDEWDYDGPDGDDDEAQEAFYESREIILPAPKESFSLPPVVEDEDQSLAFKIRGRTVQVIVKVAEIVLTPNNPTYAGGGWHTEGMRNEEIVASGIYYFDEENIDESRLAFRGTFDEELLGYEQSDDRGVERVYGIKNDGPIVQDYGSLLTKGGRAIAFPNIYQHRVEPFSLKDPSRPGHRKILVFFLVDPLKHIPSTTEVAPQQLEWAADELWKEKEKDSKLPDLPTELWSKALEETPLLSLKEAQKVREELMEERKTLVVENDRVIFSRPFSLCEH